MEIILEYVVLMATAVVSFEDYPLLSIGALVATMLISYKLGQAYKQAQQIKKLTNNMKTEVVDLSDRPDGMSKEEFISKHIEKSLKEAIRLEEQEGEDEETR